MPKMKSLRKGESVEAMLLRVRPVPPVYDCDMCDGEDGPAIARVRLREYDGSKTTLRVCKQCKKDQAEDIIKVFVRLAGPSL